MPPWQEITSIAVVEELAVLVEPTGYAIWIE
jgi:hypothetical protein